MQVEDDDGVLEWLRFEWDGQMEWDQNNVHLLELIGVKIVIFFLGLFTRVSFLLLFLRKIVIL